MGPIRSSLVLSAAALIGALSTMTSPCKRPKPAKKGAKIYCFMRSSGNDHKVSWNAAYAVIKRQRSGLFKTSPEHASVMITEAVVQDPGNFPDCGQFLGDLFGGKHSTSHRCHPCKLLICHRKQHREQRRHHALQLLSPQGFWG